jgi:flagellar basal body-associated protein FliL
LLVDNFEKLTIQKANGMQYLYIKNTMTAKTRKRKSKKTRLNGVWIFLAIVIVIAIISMLLSYFWISEDKPDVLLLPAQEQSKEATPKQERTTPITAKEIQGTWVSNYDGAMLTISGLDFELELSGVNETEKISGTLAVEGNIVTFVYTAGSKACKGPEGHYLYSIDESEELFFKLIKDTCESRKERMTASWFKL